MYGEKVLLGAGGGRAIHRGRDHRPDAWQAARNGRREGARRQGERPARTHALSCDRPGGQPRLLAGAATLYRPHPPASRASDGDRPSDRRRRQIWRAGGVPVRRDPPQDASARAALPPDPKNVMWGNRVATGEIPGGSETY